MHIISSRQTGSFELETENYSGHTFSDFFVQRDTSRGPGWFVFGRNGEKYGRKPNGEGAYIMLCARPNVRARRHVHYNGLVKRGWNTKREARTVIEFLNGRNA
jgi:hypothetical protein